MTTYNFDINLDLSEVQCTSCALYKKGCPLLKELLESENYFKTYTELRSVGDLYYSTTYQEYLTNKVLPLQLSAHHPQYGLVHKTCPHHKSEGK